VSQTAGSESAIEIAGNRFIVLGERDGVSGEAISALIEASGGTVVMSSTECYV
jgi:glycine reductase